jgi:hypothetical protein
MDIESVALHEIGHCLGLGHSSVSAAVMSETYTGVRQALHGDDASGISKLYPRQGLFWLDPDNGDYKPRGDGDWSGTSSMTSLKNHLYIIQDGRLHRVNPDTGKAKVRSFRWSGRTSMAAIDDRLYIVQHEHLHWHDPDTGHLPVDHPTSEADAINVTHRHPLSADAWNFAERL